MADVVYLGPHQRMTPEEALAAAMQQNWTEVIICGFVQGNNELVEMSSHMSRETALWIAEHTKLHVMGRL